MSIGSWISKKTWIFSMWSRQTCVDFGKKTRQAARLGRYKSNPKYAFKIYIYMIIYIIIYYILYILYILYYIYIYYIIYILYYIYHILYYIIYIILYYIIHIFAMVPVGFMIFIQSIPSLTFRNVETTSTSIHQNGTMILIFMPFHSQGGSPMADWFIS